MISYFVYPMLADSIDRKTKLLNAIVLKICKHLGITLEVIKEKNNRGKHCLPRQMAIVILSEINGFTHTDIANYFNKHRTIVFDSTKRISDYCDTDSEFKQKFENLRDLIIPNRRLKQTI